MTLQLTVDDSCKVSALLHRRRIRIDPAFRGECEWLFESDSARKAYFGKRGMTIDEAGEALWDAGFVAERPSPAEILDLLELVFKPRGDRATFVGKVEAANVIGVSWEEVDARVAKRKRNRWRVFRCDCPHASPVQMAADQLPAALAAAVCDECGACWTLRTIKLDLSNLPMMPMDSGDVCPF